MTDDPEMLPLEQRCIDPGHWLIEGHDVKRVRIDGQRVRWNISFIGEPVGNTRTLAKARELIRELS